MSLLKTPVHPGDILRHEFLEELGLGATGLARHIGVSRTRIERLCKGQTPVTIDTATRLSKTFGPTVAVWMSLQKNYDIANTA